MAFGLELQKDYATRKHAALIERLDGEGMRLSTFAVFGSDAVDSASMQTMWRDSLLPAVTKELQIFDHFPVLNIGRVLLLEGRRAIECVLTTPKGEFNLLVLWLDQASEGRVRITDFQHLGQRLETSRRMRHLFLLLGAPFSARLDEEEQDLAFRSRSYQANLRFALSELNRGNASEACRQWLGVSPELKATRIWQELRDGMANTGVPAAKADLLEDFKRGTLTNPLLRLGLAREQSDQTAALAAMDRLIFRHHQQPFLLAVKADLLRQAGRLDESLVLARRIYSDYPFQFTAYVVAIYADVQLGSLSAAMDVVKQWHALFPAAELDAILKSDPLLAPLVGSKAYTAWLKQALATATVTPPASS